MCQRCCRRSISWSPILYNVMQSTTTEGSSVTFLICHAVWTVRRSEEEELDSRSRSSQAQSLTYRRHMQYPSRPMGALPISCLAEFRLVGLLIVDLSASFQSEHATGSYRQQARWIGACHICQSVRLSYQLSSRGTCRWDKSTVGCRLQAGIRP